MKKLFIGIILLYTTNSYAQNVGIGTNNPTEKLEINGQIKITGGSPGDKKILTSDANGVGTWKDAKHIVFDATNSASIPSVGWYRIASNVTPGGKRANASFTLRDFISSGGHSTMRFHAGIVYGDDSGISFNMLNHSKFGNVTFTKVRIIDNTTYDGAYLEVYCNRTGSVEYTIFDNEQSDGWVPIDWTAGSVPSGWTAHEYNTDNIMSIGANQQALTIERNENVIVYDDFIVKGADSKVKFDTKEVNNGWTLMYRDDFETGDDGWNLYESINSSTISTEFTRLDPNVIGISTFLTTYNNGGDNNNVFKKMFDLSGTNWTEAKVVFTFYFIDSWDGEFAYAGVSNSFNSNPTVLWQVQHNLNNGPQINLLGGSWPDKGRTGQFMVDNDMGGNLYLFIGSTLNQSTTDESYAIDNIEIWIR